MKLVSSFYFLFFLLLVSTNSFAQKTQVLQLQQYQLKNGLTVFLNPDTTANNIFGGIVVNAGSKNDPAHATGIAHYLEHLLFKGTTELGTWNYEKEKVHLDAIREAYDELGKTKDSQERKKIQKYINEASVKAAQYALPNELDNLLKSIGATHVNAFTSPDMTFYHNTFPSNQLQKWLDIYAHRFQNPVFRSFQSELEVVYEEKNRAMDRMEYKILDRLRQEIFAGHPYGEQSVYGKTEHLKNPNLNEMYRFFETYYVANNMALVLTGNFDVEKAKPWIEATFGQWKRGKNPIKKTFPIQKFQGEKRVKVRYTPVKVGAFSFKTVGHYHPDRPALDVIQQMIVNTENTGLLDQLNQQNEFTHGDVLNYTMNEDGAITFFIVPKIFRQSLKSAKKILFRILDNIKQGTFSEQMLLSTQNHIITNFEQSLENLDERGVAIGKCFNQGKNWEEHLSYSEQIAQLTKQDIQNVARKYFGEDYLFLQSKMGFPKKDKLKKPSFKAVKPDASKQSTYAQYFNTQMGEEVKPKFLDFKNDMQYVQLSHNNRLYCTKNPLNSIFSISIQYQYGNDNNRDLRLATQLMKYAGVKGKNSVEIKAAFAALGASFEVNSNRNFLVISLKGRDENLIPTLQLLNTVIHYPIIDKNTLSIIKKQKVLERKIAKNNINEIGSALRHYALFGKNSHYLRRFSIDEVSHANVNQIMKKFKEGINYGADIHYTGTQSAGVFKEILTNNYQLSDKGVREPLLYMRPARYRKPHLYFIHDKKARQSHVYFYAFGDKYSPKEYPAMRAFNAYIGDGFSGLIMQEIREHRSLAYSAWGYSFLSSLRDGQPTFFNAFVGCQSDKTNQAIKVMMQLLTDLPEHPHRMERIQQMLQQQTIANYPMFRNVSSSIVEYKREGYRKSPNELYYNDFLNVSLEDVTKYYNKHIQNHPIIITIYGNKKEIDFKALQKYGEVEELKLKDVMVF